MSRLKRQILMLAISLGAVLAAKVYINRKLAQQEAPADPGVTVETTAVPGPLAKTP